MRQALRLKVGDEPEQMDGLSGICRGGESESRSEEDAQDPDAIEITGCETCGVPKGEYCERASGKRMLLRTHTRRQAQARSQIVIEKVRDIMLRAEQWR